ncbi:hypothetical protein [Micropruina sp.]|uniref:hypothetical protein n=1 Tax=Micropruina sp. TaxID=2737536 RepID=UPI0039E28611
MPPRRAVSPATPGGAAQRRFWRFGLALCVVLALLAAGVGVGGLLRGPDLSEATFAADRAVGAAGARLVLRSRLPIAEVRADQVSITPAAPYTLGTRDQTLTITFGAPLGYATDYTVTVAGVRSEYTSTTADWSYRFVTPPVTMYSLIAHRDEPAADDTVVTGADRRTVLSGPGIETFVATRQHLIALSHPSLDTSQLIATTRSDGASAPVATPQVPLLTELEAAPDGTRFGYLATGVDDDTQNRYEGALFIADAADLTAAPRRVDAFGGALSVQEWLFVPGVNAVVVITPQEKAFLIYLDGDTAPVALGSVAQFVGFLPGSTTLLAQAGGKQLLLDLSAGKTTEVPNTEEPSSDVFAGRRNFRAPDDYLVEFNQFTRTGNTSELTTRLTHLAGGQSTELLVLGPADGQLSNSGLSPNGQFAWAVLLDPDAPVADLSSGASDHARTLVFDLATARQVAEVPGSSPVWAL